jgi:hypothetical protein
VSVGSERIQCYDCGESYRYLGRQHHPGECPACNSHCVSPAGKVSILTTVEVSTEGTTSTVTVLAIDERRRRYLYHFSNTEGQARLLALRVDGDVVQSVTEATRSTLPAALCSVVEQYLSIKS